MNELLKMRFFALLADTSLKVSNVEINNAYDDFINYVITISNSEDYSNIFRTLNFTHIEIASLKKIFQYEQEKKCF